MNSHNEVVIVAGAGPAGSVTAFYLALHGVPVVLLPHAQALRNCQMMRMAQDPVEARRFVMRGAMIESLPEAAAIQ